MHSNITLDLAVDAHDEDRVTIRMALFRNLRQYANIKFWNDPARVEQCWHLHLKILLFHTSPPYQYHYGALASWASRVYLRIKSYRKYLVDNIQLHSLCH